MANEKKDEQKSNPVKLMKEWMGTLKAEQRKALEEILTPEQQAAFKVVDTAAEPTVAEIKKFIGTLTHDKVVKIAGKVKLTGSQIAQAMSLKQLVK